MAKGFNTKEEYRKCQDNPECWERHQRVTRKVYMDKWRAKHVPTIKQALISDEAWHNKQGNWAQSGIINPPSREMYTTMVEIAGGICPLCGRKPGKKGFHLHHNHYTGEWVGLLCSSCNLGLGQFSDDPELLSRAAQYVKNEPIQTELEDLLIAEQYKITYLTYTGWKDREIPDQIAAS
jgi:hypothetical protein